MTIKAKILALVAAFAIMAAAICTLGLLTMADYNRAIAVYTRASDDAFRAQKLNLLVADSIIEMRNVYLTKTPEQLARRTGALQGRIDETRALMAEWKTSRTIAEVPDLDYMETGASSVGAFGEKVISIARAEGPQAAEKFGLNPTSISGREGFQARLDAIAGSFQAKLTRTRQDLQLYQKQRMADFVLAAGGGTLLMLMASLWIALNSIANPLRRVTQSVIRISEGAYDTAIPATTRGDEISRLWGALAILKDRAIEAKRLTDEKLELRLD